MNTRVMEGACKAWFNELAVECHLPRWLAAAIKAHSGVEW